MDMHLTKIFVKQLAALGVAACIGLLSACSSSDPTKVEADFQINSVKGSVSGLEVTIDLTAKEACTDLTNLVADVEAYGASVSPNPKVARDYSQPVKFTVTAPDGTQVVYTVTVKGNSCGYTPPPTPTSCTPAAIGTTGYSLVFKGCDANNVATYYDKTECVRDNGTGLIWQGQTGPGTGLRGNDQFKSNFDSTSERQKWGEGWTTPSESDIDAVDNSVGFSKAVNATSLCGQTDWRVPAANELACLITGTSAPYIDQLWFPNTPSPSPGYWTSTAYVFAARSYIPLNGINIEALALWIDFDNGYASTDWRDPMYNEEPGKLVRLVRGSATKTCEPTQPA